MGFRCRRPRQIDKAFYRPIAQIPPHSLVFGVNLVSTWMGGHIDTEQAQAFERAVDGLRVLRLDRVNLNLQPVNGCLVDR